MCARAICMPRPETERRLRLSGSEPDRCQSNSATRSDALLLAPVGLCEAGAMPDCNWLGAFCQGRVTECGTYDRSRGTLSTSPGWSQPIVSTTRPHVWRRETRSIASGALSSGTSAEIWAFSLPCSTSRLMPSNRSRLMSAEKT